MLRLNILNPLNAELNPICHLLSLLGAHHILHVSRIRVKNPSHHSTGLQDFNFNNVILQNFNAGSEPIYGCVRNASNKTRCISRACSISASRVTMAMCLSGEPKWLERPESAVLFPAGTRDISSRKCVISVVCVKPEKLYVVKHNYITWGVFNDYIMDNYMFRPVLTIFRLS